MVRPAQQGHESRGLLEEARKPLDVLDSLLPCVGLLGRLGAHDQNAADSIGRGVIIDGPKAVRPIGVIPPPIAGDGDEHVFLPGRLAPVHDLVDLRADGVPDFRPHHTSGLPQRGGVAFGPYGAPVGVIVKAKQLRSPPHVHRMAGVEEQPKGGAEWLRPSFRRADLRTTPVVSPDELAHFSAAAQKG